LASFTQKTVPADFVTLKAAIARRSIHRPVPTKHAGSLLRAINGALAQETFGRDVTVTRFAGTPLSPKFFHNGIEFTIQSAYSLFLQVFAGSVPRIFRNHGPAILFPGEWNVSIVRCLACHKHAASVWVVGLVCAAAN
jgi:hypothetical protein